MFADHQFYIGYTTNLEQRLKDHNDGKTKSTKGRRPLKLIFYEGYLNKRDALRREKYFKTTAGKRVIQVDVKSPNATSIMKQSFRESRGFLCVDPTGREVYPAKR